MKKFRAWLVEQFLPSWAKQTVLEENKKLKEQNLELCREVGALKSYIDGLEAGIKAQRRIIITTGGAAK